MKRIATAVAVAGMMVFSAASASAQKGQLFVYGTGGALLPMGDFGDGAKTGWIAGAGLGYDITNHLFLTGGYRLSSNKLKAIDDNIKLSGFDGGLGYTFGGPTAKIFPYVRGSIVMVKAKVGDGEAGDSDTGFAGAFGLYKPSGKGGFFVEGQYNTISGDVSDTNFLTLGIGFTYALKQGKMN